MPALSRRNKNEFVDILERMPDEKIRYFYMMLGSAIADRAEIKPSAQVNTSPAHLVDLERRLNQG